MKKGVVMAALVLVLALAWLVRLRATPLKPGDKAPNFSLTDQNGRIVRLADFLGRKTVVLAFYVKAFTPG